MKRNLGIISHQVGNLDTASPVRKIPCMGSITQKRPGRRLRKLDLIGRHGIRENTIQKRLKRK